MKLGIDGREFIEGLEGRRFDAYQDSGGVWTIGVGHTSPHVHKGMRISGAEVDELFAHDVRWAERAVNTMVQPSLTTNQFTALVSFVFNIGASAFHGSTLLKRLNHGDTHGAAEQFYRWNHDNGKVVAGLTNRRRKEKERFIS